MKKLITQVFLFFSLHVCAQPCIPNTNSILFDGVSSYVTISPQAGFDITTAITIEAWINPSSFGFDQAQNSIVCKHGWSSGEGGYVLRCGGTGQLSFNIAGIDVNQIPVSWVELISSANALTANTWMHVAGTFDGTELKCYVNGNLEGTTAFTGTIAPSTAYPLALGRLADPVYGPDRYFAGSMDEVRVWNRALSQTEIQSGMNNHIDPSTATGLVSYWRMNEGTNATVYDVAGTNNGGMVNCSWDTQVPFNAVPTTPVITYFNDTLTSSAAIGNQWYLDGNAIGGATQITLLPLQNGLYTVEVTSPEGCSIMSTGLMITDVLVHELKNQVHFSVVPNPFADKATIEITSPQSSGTASLKVTDVQGRVVMDINNIEVTSSQIKIPLDKANLISGIYFYELCLDGNQAGLGKFIVE
jgi:hypothetical protein